MIPANAFLEVNLKNLVSNYKYLSFINKNHITGATIKANAYGLGDKKIINILYMIITLIRIWKYNKSKILICPVSLRKNPIK